MGIDYQQYTKFNQQRTTLAALIAEQKGLLEALRMSGWLETLRKLRERVLADSFKVLVVGEFKRGKSTFINALLRQEVLPAYAKPCTAIINEVKWGEERRAFLYPRVVEGNGNGGSHAEPVEVPVDRLAEHVVIKEFGREAASSPYEKAEVFWPLELCRHGVEIIDSPGLNENEVRQQITINYLSSVDAVLFVVSCEALGPSISESEAIRILRASGHKDIFFICNRFDGIRPRERDEIVQHGIRQFAPHTDRGAARVFFISAQDALEGYLDRSDEQVERSRLPPLESALEAFLATERGRVKLIRAANELKASIAEARRVIPERQDMLETDLATLEARYARAQEPLRQLETERARIVARVGLTRREVELRVSSRAELAFRGLADEVDNWVAVYTVKEPLKLTEVVMGSRREPAVERVVAEILSHLASQVASEMMTWQERELQPLLTDAVTRLGEELDQKIGDFLAHVDDVRVELAPSTVTPRTIGVTDERASPLNRALSAVGGLIAMDIGSGALGAAFGHKEMLRSLLPQLALQLMTVALVGLNPVAMVGVALAQAWFQGFSATGRVTDAVKKRVAEKYVQHVRKTAREQGRSIGEQMGMKLAVLETVVDNALVEQTKGVREQVESILAEKQGKGADVEKTRQELKTMRRRLDELDGRLDDLITDVALA